MFNKIFRQPVWIMFLVVLLDLLGFGIIIPILPFLFTDPSSPYSLLDGVMSERAGYIIFGALVATYPLFQFLAAPVLGQLSDKYGRKPILTISLAGTAFSYLIFALGLIERSIPILFFARAIDGLTGGNISVAQAVIADTASHKERTKQFGLLGAGFGIGLILGPYVGGKLADPGVVSWFSLQTPFLFAAALGIFNVLGVLFLLPETLKREHRHRHVRWFQAFDNIGDAARLRKLRILFTTGFLFQCGFAFFTTFISVFLYKNFAFNQGTIGEFFAFAGLWIAFTQAVITKIVHGKFTDAQLVYAGLIGCAIFIFLLLIIDEVWMLLVVTALFAIANGLSQTSFLSLVSTSVSERDQGRILGINSSVYAFGQAVPPLVSGFIAASVHAEAPIIVAAAFIAAAALLFVTFYRKARLTHEDLSREGAL